MIKNETTIILPDDQKLKKQLGLKLEEYKDRLKSSMQKDPYKAPETFIHYYAVKIFEAVLTDERIETAALSREIFNSVPDTFLARSYFNSYCAVLLRYVHGESEYLAGGTGLPNLD